MASFIAILFCSSKEGYFFLFLNISFRYGHEGYAKVLGCQEDPLLRVLVLEF